MKKSQEPLPVILHQTGNEFSISIYRGELSTEVLIDCAKKIKKAFPALPQGFYDVLSQRLKHHGFSNERLQDAVDNVIDTCIYPTPTIANFVSFDRRIKVLSYDEYLKKVDECGAWIGKDYKPVRFANQERPVWIHVNDIKKYNIKDEI